MKRLSHQKAWAVEFPADVEDERAAVGMMGGEESLGRVGRGEVPSVKLEWMEGTHPVQSSATEFRGMHVHVAEDGETEVMAIVDTMHRFEELCDFVFVQTKSTEDEFGRMGSVVTAQGRLFEKTVTEEPHFETEPLMTIAPRFSQIRHPVEAVVKGKTVPMHVMKGKERTIPSVVIEGEALR